MYESQPPSHDEVRTLFIAGLPEDAKHREIYNLFRDFPGYESCQLRNSGHSSQAFGFAIFSDQQSAVAAMHALNGIVFDLEKDSTLHIDLAKSNSRSKRSRTEDKALYSSEKKVRRSHANSLSMTDTGHGSNIHVSGLGKSALAHSTNGNSSSQSAMDFYHNVTTGFDATKDSLGASASQNNPPCPTLFVANLGPACSEHELTQVFSRCPGFLKLKMQNKRGVPVAFIDFQDATCSTGALNSLQGLVLRSSEGEGMRLEYAKSRMGLRKRER